MRKYDVLEQNRHYFWNQHTKISRNKYSSYIQKKKKYDKSQSTTVIPSLITVLSISSKFDVKSFLTLIYDNQFLSATLQNASKPTREVIGLSAG